MAAAEWTEIQKVRNQERRQQLEQQAARRADCNKEANEQKLGLRERRAFLKSAPACSSPVIGVRCSPRNIAPI